MLISSLAGENSILEIRKMQIRDYDDVYALWMSCAGMGLNDVDDSEEGIAKFLQRNPDTCFGWLFDNAVAVYVIVNTVLILIYCLIWIFCFKKNSMFRALSLSIIPSVIFLFSGIMTRSVLLIIASVLFAPSHILISYKNAK